MEVTFICGCLEPGRDGVGDYTRRLAGELQRQGISLSLVALNDNYAAKETNEVQEGEGCSVEVLRIPAHFDHLKRFSSLQKFVELKSPSWISLQFVPYAFQPKGLPLQLVKGLKNLKTEAKWHIMFHELWVGTEDGNYFKMKMVAYLQKFIIKHLLKALRPKVVHTHLPLYKKEIDKFGYNVLDLTLFSNVEKIENGGSDKSKSALRVCFFSQVSAGLEIVKLLQHLKKEARENNKEFQILVLGGSSLKSHQFKKEILQAMGSDTIIYCTGFLSTDQISGYLLDCDLGITTVPQHALGKSGSVAAFLSHNVPVAAPVNEKFYSNMDIGFFNQKLRSSIIVDINSSSIETARIATSVAKDELKISKIAKTFLLDLQSERVMAGAIV
jgi:hypothetical protein